MHEVAQEWMMASRRGEGLGGDTLTLPRSFRPRPSRKSPAVLNTVIPARTRHFRKVTRVQLRRFVAPVALKWNLLNSAQFATVRCRPELARHLRLDWNAFQFVEKICDARLP